MKKETMKVTFLKTDKKFRYATSNKEYSYYLFSQNGVEVHFFSEKRLSLVPGQVYDIQANYVKADNMKMLYMKRIDWLFLNLVILS